MVHLNLELEAEIERGTTYVNPLESLSSPGDRLIITELMAATCDADYGRIRKLLPKAQSVQESIRHSDALESLLVRARRIASDPNAFDVT